MCRSGLPKLFWICPTIHQAYHFATSHLCWWNNTICTNSFQWTKSFCSRSQNLLDVGAGSGAKNFRCQDLEPEPEIWVPATHLWYKQCTYVGTDGFREHGALGHLSFGGPKQVWPIWPLVWKAWKYAPLMCSSPSKVYLLLCRIWFYICLTCSTEIKAFPTFF